MPTCSPLPLPTQKQIIFHVLALQFHIQTSLQSHPVLSSLVRKSCRSCPFLSYLGHWLCAVISFSASSSNSHLPTPQTNTRGLWQKGFQFNFTLFLKNFSFPLSPSDWQLRADLRHFRFSSAGRGTVRVYMISLPSKKQSQSRFFLHKTEVVFCNSRLSTFTADFHRSWALSSQNHHFLLYICE